MSISITFQKQLMNYFSESMGNIIIDEKLVQSWNPIRIFVLQLETNVIIGSGMLKKFCANEVFYVI